MGNANPSSVPEATVDRLLSLLTAQGVSLPSYRALLDVSRCSQFMREFKLDVSVSLRAHSSPRFSLNDTGEPDDFRSRLHSHHEQIGLSSSELHRFLSLSPPGEVQTTLSLKWEDPLRTTLYFEELSRHPDSSVLRRSMFDEFLSVAPPRQDHKLMALAVDYQGGVPVALKEYGHVDLAKQPELAPTVAPLLMTHARTSEKRAMIAQRYDLEGGPLGDKILWVTEANSPQLAAKVWRHVAGLVKQLSFDKGPGWALVRQLVADWPYGPDVVPYPDLVCLNRSSTGQVEDLILYVSLK